jgi:hypothetical protein
MLQVPFPRALSLGAGTTAMTGVGESRMSDLYNPWTSNTSCHTSCNIRLLFVSSATAMRSGSAAVVAQPGSDSRPASSANGLYAVTETTQPRHPYILAPIIKNSSSLRLAGSRSNGSLGYETDDTSNSNSSSSWIAMGRSRRVSFEDEEYGTGTGNKSMQQIESRSRQQIMTLHLQAPNKTSFTRRSSYDEGVMRQQRPMAMRLKRQTSIPGGCDNSFYARVCHQVG